jgi:hypothetical protein
MKSDPARSRSGEHQRAALAAWVDALRMTRSDLADSLAGYLEAWRTEVAELLGEWQAEMERRHDAEAEVERLRTERSVLLDLLLDVWRQSSVLAEYNDHEGRRRVAGGSVTLRDIEAQLRQAGLIDERGFAPGEVAGGR